MVLNSNANWTAAAASARQAPVYYVDVDGYTTEDYSTAPVKSPSRTKVVCLQQPRGVSRSVDILGGKYSPGSLSIELLDVDDKITALIGTEAAGAPVATMINRQFTVYGGYADLDESDYAVLFVGRVTGIKANRDLTGYVFALSDLTYQLDGEIMSASTDTKTTKVRGNIVNLYWSILTGTFSTVHATFPLEFVDTDTGSTAAPTGLGLATTLINTAQLVDERDSWHSDDVAEIEFDEPIDAREYLEAELFRAFQCAPTVSGGGLLGLKFHTPALPPSAAPVVTADHIVKVSSWTRLIDEHLNKYSFAGDHNLATDAFANLYDTETTEDTTDQAATEETIEYVVESRWLRSAYNGAEIAEELADRLRIRYRGGPAQVVLSLNLIKTNLEQGDVITVTHPHLPDLLTGTRGIAGRAMTILSLDPDFTRGEIRVTAIDTGYRRYGVITPAATASGKDYLSASGDERGTFFYFCDAADDEMSNGDPGYRYI